MNKEKPQLAKEVRDRYKEFTISKPTADEWIEWAMNKGIEPEVIARLSKVLEHPVLHENDFIKENSNGIQNS
jgi:hypothetical protein